MNPSKEEVIQRIETLTLEILRSLYTSTPEKPNPPCIQAPSTPTRTLTNLSTCRSFASIILILSFVHSLLIQDRTTTTREVYYFYVTHFRSQKECDGCIYDVAKLLRVGRIHLGLSASPKGWFCGLITIQRVLSTKRIKRETSNSTNIISMDGTCTPSIQGLPITHEWLKNNDVISPTVQITSNAKCILIIEKEGIYTRLSEDRFYEQFPCILITGRGFPDLATRAFVHTLYVTLQIPVIGICDCNPFGVSVLQTYEKGADNIGLDGTLYSVPIYWLGLKPSHVISLQKDSRPKSMQESKFLPDIVFQQMTPLDFKRVQKLIAKEKAKDGQSQELIRELTLMQKNAYKVELEAFHWLGMNYLTNWLRRILHELIQMDPHT